MVENRPTDFRNANFQDAKSLLLVGSPLRIVPGPIILSRMNKKFLLTVLLAWSSCDRCVALDLVSFEREGRTVHIQGRIVTESADGGLLVEDRESILWAIQPEELSKRSSDNRPFSLMDAEELERHLLGQHPSGFQIYQTAHYTICHNTSPAYAAWCGALYERLFLAFRNYWNRRGFDLPEPPMPLVAFVFDDKDSYGDYAKTEVGEAYQSIIGYYSLRTNRVTMYDLTGAQGLRGAGSRLTSTAQINRLLMQPGAERMVATIIHEATHQLAFNSGMHTRYADIPLWLSEGLAVYFETPDLRSSKGWRNIGDVNRFRLSQFRQFLQRRPENSLLTLLADDGRFRQSKTALDAYAEAWALNYYLIRQKPKEYAAFLKATAEKPPLIYDSPEERVAEFLQAFGNDLKGLDEDFLRYMRTVR